MATGAQIQKVVPRHHGFIQKTGRIAHVGEVHGPVVIVTSSRARPKSVRRSKRRFGVRRR
jgi:hypothetical protein